MFKKYLPWIVLGLIIVGLIGFGIKIFNSTPDINPYNMEINRLNSELSIQKNKTDSIDRKAKEWEKLYLEESKKIKIVIKRTNEKTDSIKNLPISDALKYHSEWTKLAVPGIPE